MHNAYINVYIYYSYDRSRKVILNQLISIYWSGDRAWWRAINQRAVDEGIIGGKTAATKRTSARSRVWKTRGARNPSCGRIIPCPMMRAGWISRKRRYPWSWKISATVVSRDMLCSLFFSFLLRRTHILIHSKYTHMTRARDVARTKNILRLFFHVFLFRNGTCAAKDERGRENVCVCMLFRTMLRHGYSYPVFIICIMYTNKNVTVYIFLDRSIDIRLTLYIEY